MTLKNVRAAVDRAIELSGQPDISVWSVPGLDADAIALSVRASDPGCERLPHAKMQEARTGDLRAVGLEVFKSEPPPHHHTVRLDANPADNQLEALMAAFSEARENPARRPK